MNKNLVKVSTLCLAGTALLTASQLKTIAASFTVEKPVAGISLSLDSFYNTTTVGNMSVVKLNMASTEATVVMADDTLSPEEEPVMEEPETSDEAEIEKAIKKYENIGIATVDNYLNIRKKPGEDEKIIGKLPKNAGATIYDIDKNGWAKIKSGKVTGYVMSSFLTTGKEAEELAKKVGVKTATVNTTTLKVREKPSTDSTCITLIPIEEELEVIKTEDEWVKVVVDNDKGWVSKEFVDISYDLKKAVPNEELGASSGVSSTRANMVAFAKQYLGNRYVWGGTSLTNGTDCSGFTMSIYSHFGIGISRTSRAQATNGTTISSSQARPGDLIFYSNGGGINHVAMCIGNGQVIHASNPRSGIKISNMYYRTPVKAVRILND
ncbi:SH3 domain-containing protein [Mobilisporobacter senegalensis]|uniref:SH3 domain-containing protein n=1 Tax=Mobilisporobacter senegalensis TaxID=1329262 RepID=A0A3N1XRU7_9FIRM|nr:C40 family peptidase [Mobilisporobacter senegalensis]ROR29384.1 SH3 domain-containing protein [Mobilisporobacter senegalensis]